MKAMKKSELASQAGVTVKTFMNWCRPYREELSVMGLNYHCCLAIVNNIHSSRVPCYIYSLTLAKCTLAFASL